MDVSKIKIGSTTYNIKDTVARNAITNGTHFIGKLVEDSQVDGAADSIVDGDSPSIIETTLGVYTKNDPLDDTRKQLQSGDMVLVGTTGTNKAAPREFMWDGSKFQELGSTGALKDLAFKDSASGSVTAAGTNANSSVTFTGTTTSDFVTGVKVAATPPSFQEGAFTPASFTEGFYTAGTAATYSHSGFSGGSLSSATKSNFATEGTTVSYADETLTFGAANTSSAVTALGTFTPAQYGTDTFNAGILPTVDVSKFNGGSKVADNFNAGSSATFNTAKAVTSLGSATALGLTFTGSPVNVTVV